MGSRKFDLKKVLTPGDFVAAAVIIIGLLIAIFLTELAIRLIGLSIAILGGVALFMLISQRLSEIVDTRYKPGAPAPDYKITIRKDEAARRQVIEDFDTSFPAEESDEKKQTAFEAYESSIRGEEGFRIITSKSKFRQKPLEDTSEVDKPAEPEPPIEKPASVVGEKPAPQPDEKKTRAPEKPAPAPKKTEPEPNQTHREPDTIEKDIEEIEQKLAGKNASEKPQPTSEKPEPQAAEKPAADEKPANFVKKHVDVPLSTLYADLPIRGAEPRKEFEYSLARILMVIRQVSHTRTAAFMLINHEKNEIMLESFVSEKQDAIIKNPKFPIRNDIISQIANNAKPEILTEINPSAELDLLPYYTDTVGTSSFIGMPVVYQESVVGILCADSKETNAYDSFTVGFMGHFSKLISTMIQSYTEKYDLLQASRTLEAITLFETIVFNESMTGDDILESLIESVNKILDYDTCRICAYDEENGGWIIKALHSKTGEGESISGSPIDLENTLAGESIITNKTVVSRPVEPERVRTHPREVELPDGFFVSAPMKTASCTYGSIYIEGINAASISSYDIGILEVLAEHAASNIEKLQFMNMLHTSALIDATTGILNPPAFYRRLEEEVIRTGDFSVPMSLCLLQIDKYASLDPEQFRGRTEKALYHVLNLAHGNLRLYDVFGRADNNTFGIALVGMDIDQAKMWAERLRNEIAISQLEMEGRKFSVTVSIGVADTSRAGNIDMIVTNARKMLDKSLDKTNSVSVFT
ncbi:MAG: GAF domain-containing protein [Candidatus Kapaibacterium sp.]